MKEIHKRIISGLVYICIMWFCTYYSKYSFHTLFFIIFFISLYEMKKLRINKSVLLPYTIIITPFLTIHLIDREIILFMFILTWTFDSFAYITGVNFGDNKINTHISPNKSWEGLSGGALFTVISALIIINFNIIDINSMTLNKLYFLTILLPFTASLGDFIISYFKRQANVKDTGTVIPGHGGILDRFDAFLITIPLIYILTKI